MMRYAVRLIPIIVAWLAIVTPATADHFVGAPELHGLAAYGKLELGTEEAIAKAKELIDGGADVNEKAPVWGFTPLHMATVYGDETMAEFLIAHGARIDGRDYHELTPLHWAAFAGPGLEMRIYGDDEDPSDTLERLKGRAAVATLLIAKGADVNARAGMTTPLHIAAASANKPVVELLLANRADVTAKDDEGATPLDRLHEVAALVSTEPPVPFLINESWWAGPRTLERTLKEMALAIQVSMAEQSQSKGRSKN